jgi:glutamine---fructose-6-phosphate transaminase (isomerizing)
LHNVCGIIAVVSQHDGRPPDDPADIRAELDAVAASMQGVDAARPHLAAVLDMVANRLDSLNRRLRSLPGMRTLVADPGLRELVQQRAHALLDDLGAIEASLDERAADGPDLENVNRAVVATKDAAWAMGRDRVRTAQGILDLAGPECSAAAVEAMWSVQVALAAIDRLEVRGRDSAGLQILVRDHGLEGGDELVSRAADPVYRSGAVRTAGPHLVFVYKAAAEIGELGDNTTAIRGQIRDDALLRAALRSESARVTVLGHTRWASVGIISEANAHPLDELEGGGTTGPFVSAVLNGDVDNFADLKVANDLDIAPEITTDAKVIPTLISRRLQNGVQLDEAFRSTVCSLDGSVAIGALCGADPDRLLLALRGSGQALYVGLVDGSYVVASEPYGVVEETDGYLRMDGETPADPANPVASRGQIIELDRARAGTLEGIRRRSYDGREHPVGDSEIVVPEITTRDIDRGEHPHFLLKEIGESPRSLRATLRGRIVDSPDGLRVRLGPETLSPELADRLARGRIRRVLATGQGTAAVAARAFARFLDRLLAASDISVEALPATELSGFQLRGDMSDTLVVAISQSGTTTDTNRTVDLVRSRGGVVIGIVNRRGSDLTDKADGVLYTSDGRDVEMAVASTKAFYAQVAAGALLAHAIADLAAPAMVDQGERNALLSALRRLPDAMASVIADRARIGEVAARHAPPKRYWAIVGNGANRIAASEIRIKLSELCYKAIAEDATEDKKHIDLSSEPLIFVCAAGLTGSTADDVAKEVAIYRAHKATPIVVASRGESRFAGAYDVLTVPSVHPELDFVLSTVVGHLFGYEAALAIDAQAMPLREARMVIETALADGELGEDEVDHLRDALRTPASRFIDDLRSGRYDGHLETATAVQLTDVFRFATGTRPLDQYQVEMGKVGTPSVVVGDLSRALATAIDELTRPVDAIKHQAKTVTVGISRADEALLQVPLVRSVMEAGAARDRLTYGNLRLLAALDPAVDAVTGSTRYRVEGDLDAGASVQVIDRAGIALDIPSRTEQDPTLRGTKHRAASEQVVTVSKGRGDGRTTVIVPELKDGQCTGITLLHVRFADHLAAGAMRTVLEGYRDRYAAVVDAVTEVDPAFRDDLLEEIPVIDLLSEPVYVLAGHWTGERR